MAGEARPVFGALQDVEQVAFRQAIAQHRFEGGEPLGRRHARQLAKVGPAVGIDAERAVVRKARVDHGGDGLELGLELLDRLRALGRQAYGGAVGRHPRRAGRPRQQLRPVVGEALAADDVEVAAEQRVGEVDEDADLERTAVDDRGAVDRGRDEVAPALRGEAEVEGDGDILALGVATCAHLAPSGEHGLVSGRRADLQAIEDAQQQRAVALMDRPEQRQVVVLVTGGDRTHALGNRPGAALHGEDRAHARAEGGVVERRLGLLGHPAEQADEGLLEAAVLGAQRLERLTGGRPGAPDPAQEQLDELVTGGHARLAHEREQEGVALGGAGDVEQAVDLHGRGLGRELAQLGVGDALEGPLVVRQRLEIVEALDPKPQRRRRQRARRLLQAIERRGRRSFPTYEQGVEGGTIDSVEAGGDLTVERVVSFRAQTADEPVEGAEGGKVDVRLDERLDRAVDEVGRIAHRRGGGAHGPGDERAPGVAEHLGAEAQAHGVLVAIVALGARGGGDPGGERACLELVGKVVDNLARHLARRREETEVRTGLEHEREQQPPGVAAGVAAQEGVFGLDEIVVRAQLGTVGPAPRTRVGRALDGGHGVSGKGGAESPRRGELDQGVRG